MRFITLDGNSKVMAIREAATIVDGEIQSDTGELGQIMQPDGTFITPESIPQTLSEIQQNKILELNTACNQTIMNGFPSTCTGVEHQYKFDMEYQGNFAQQGVMLSLDPTIDTVLWPVSDLGVIPHSREQFIQLCKDAQTWKATNTYRYFGLKAQVLGCETADAVNMIVW